jgi:transcriptional regulator with XRE-family HTH domain
MTPAKFKEIRTRLGLKQSELGELLGLKGRIAVTHYETGFRNPNRLIEVLMEILSEWPEKKSLELRVEILKRMRESGPKKKRKPS